MLATLQFSVCHCVCGLKLRHSIVEPHTEQKMSGMIYSGSGTNREIDDQASVLPGYVTFLSLVFKLTATLIIVLLTAWVVYTIKTTRSLHKPDNLFVANLLISDVIYALCVCLFSGTVVIGFQLGMKDVFSCMLYKFGNLPALVTNISFVTIAADKVIAVTFPFKHKRMMTPRAIAAIISGVWLLALIPTISSVIFNTDGVIDVPEYGACVFKGTGFIEFFVTFVAPIVVASILSVTLNIYLAVKAYQIRKQIAKETRLSGVCSQSAEVVALGRKQRNIRRNMKPIITLLVVISCSVLISLFLVPLHILGFVIAFSDVLAYGLYFRQVREPMMRCLKRSLRMNQVNSIAPQP
ncbi:adenosine receptor A2b-like [Dysidea avara]|uniref:adenosine receptor A2b-like n=1 Tax=Dysidea avara TaxID=196820 RepID=UPI003327C84A